ncbi:hypothetical protein Pelo_16054 [Pelomyxa schiedti]|nr:hypothetical protein Pelo_16054 [Pelomyxa schiedti]
MIDGTNDGIRASCDVERTTKCRAFMVFNPLCGVDPEVKNSICADAIGDLVRAAPNLEHLNLLGYEPACWVSWTGTHVSAMSALHLLNAPKLRILKLDFEPEGDHPAKRELAAVKKLFLERGRQLSAIKMYCDDSSFAFSKPAIQGLIEAATKYGPLMNLKALDFSISACDLYSLANACGCGIAVAPHIKTLRVYRRDEETLPPHWAAVLQVAFPSLTHIKCYGKLWAEIVIDCPILEDTENRVMYDTIPILLSATHPLGLKKISVNRRNCKPRLKFPDIANLLTLCPLTTELFFGCECLSVDVAQALASLRHLRKICWVFHYPDSCINGVTSMDSLPEKSIAALEHSTARVKQWNSGTVDIVMWGQSGSGQAAQDDIRLLMRVCASTIKKVTLPGDLSTRLQPIVESLSALKVVENTMGSLTMSL